MARSNFVSFLLVTGLCYYLLLSKEYGVSYWNYSNSIIIDTPPPANDYYAMIVDDAFVISQDIDQSDKPSSGQATKNDSEAQRHAETNMPIHILDYDSERGIAMMRKKSARGTTDKHAII